MSATLCADVAESCRLWTNTTWCVSCSRSRWSWRKWLSPGVDRARKGNWWLQEGIVSTVVMQDVWSTVKFGIYTPPPPPSPLCTIFTPNWEGGGVYSEFVQKIRSIRPCTTFVCTCAYSYNTNRRLHVNVTNWKVGVYIVTNHPSAMPRLWKWEWVLPPGWAYTPNFTVLAFGATSLTVLCHNLWYVSIVSDNWQT